MNQGDDSTLKLGTSASVDGGGRESLPDNRLTNVCCDEERDATAETVTLLEELVKKNDNQGGSEKLDNEKNADTGTEIGRQAVETGEDVDTGLAEGEDDGEELQGSVWGVFKQRMLDMVTFWAVW
jgi:hypothetical protein